MGKYTINGSSEFDALVDRHMERVADEAWTSSYSRHWNALVLCGSYGRGEGASVFRHNGPALPFDGYELVLVTTRLTPLIRGAAQILQERMTEGLGIPVKITPLLRKTISAAKCTLGNYELKYGHRVIRGDENILSRLPDYHPEDIALSEGTRRLTHHGGLLLEIKHRLSTNQPLSAEERRQFVRYILNATLAFGDCILLMRKSAGLSRAERLERLKAIELPGLYDSRGVVNAYRQAVEFKDSGDSQPYETSNLHLWLEETSRNFRNVFLWYEQRRLNRTFSEIKRYAHAFPNLGTEGTLFGNMKANLRAFGIPGLFGPAVHPRLRLYAATLLLLAEQINPDELRWVLRSRLGTSEGLYDEYRKLLELCG